MAGNLSLVIDRLIDVKTLQVIFARRDCKFIIRLLVPMVRQVQM